MNLLWLASPYSGDIPRNVRYARDAMRDALARGEAPFASHLLYPQALDDAAPEERARSMQASYEWMGVCTRVAFYIDLGWSRGMREDLTMTIILRKPITLRVLDLARAPEIQHHNAEALIQRALEEGLEVTIEEKPI